MSQPLVLPFPPPDGAELKKAYRNLYLSANGTEADKKRIGNPANLPRPWDPPSCTNPALRRELWTWLDEFVIWFNREYVWDHNAGMIPACWPQHPHLVHEIAVLADQRRRAGLDPTSSALEEWHRFGIPGFLQRVTTRTKNSCDEHHAQWPAEARHERGASAAAATVRAKAFAADVAALRPLVAAPESKATSRRALRLPSGELVNPVTGEML
jgi:hypothetical protein